MQAPVWIRWLYATIPIVAAAIQFFVLNPKWGTPLTRMLVSLFLAYLPTYPITNYYSRRSGFATPWFQRMPLWHHFRRYMRAKITTEEDLDHKTAYIFCCFPHGACTLSHLLTMTDCCGMLSKVHSGARRDLSASILFQIPVLKDILLMLGCVDASSFTAKYNLKRSRSLFIFVGGEKEQLTAAPGVHKIFLKERKGFIKLALQFGTPLVPMVGYCSTRSTSSSSCCSAAQCILLWIMVVMSYDDGVGVCDVAVCFWRKRCLPYVQLSVRYLI